MGIPRATLLFLIGFYAAVILGWLRRPEFLLDLLPLVFLALLIERRRRA